MRVIFRFGGGITKTEDWRDDTKLLENIRLIKPRFTQIVEYIDDRSHVYMPNTDTWNFRLLRTWKDENDKQHALYELI